MVRIQIFLQCTRPGFDPWVGKIPWRRAWQPTPVSLPGESHGQRSLAGYSPWGGKESDRTERLTHTHTVLTPQPGIKPIPYALKGLDGSYPAPRPLESRCAGQRLTPQPQARQHQGPWGPENSHPFMRSSHCRAKETSSRLVSRT